MATVTQTMQDMSLFLIRSLDASKRQIEKIEPKSQGDPTVFTMTYKSAATVPIKISSELSAELFCNGYVVICNTQKNVKTLIENWDKALSFETLVILFLDEKTGNKWLLRPHVHAKIAEPKTLGQGLMTLFEHSMGK